ncbi:hypothetical protein Scep_010468 [Stephania cephalantha]|uniref:Uncharacterized protein n=1 Tax=Stephania cephalantha TaxID=152367 RepID=A0AAP0JV67_9MAGN
MGNGRLHDPFLDFLSSQINALKNLHLGENVSSHDHNHHLQLHETFLANVDQV